MRILVALYHCQHSYHQSFHFNHSIGRKGYFIAALICSSLRINDVECLFMCLYFFLWSIFPFKKTEWFIYFWLVAVPSCILDVDISPDTFLYVFFQSVACQFVFLVISLMKQLTLFWVPDIALSALPVLFYLFSNFYKLDIHLSILQMTKWMLREVK